MITTFDPKDDLSTQKSSSTFLGRLFCRGLLMFSHSLLEPSVSLVSYALRTTRAGTPVATL